MLRPGTFDARNSRKVGRLLCRRHHERRQRPGRRGLSLPNTVRWSVCEMPFFNPIRGISRLRSFCEDLRAGDRSPNARQVETMTLIESRHQCRDEVVGE